MRRVMRTDLSSQMSNCCFCRQIQHQKLQSLDHGVIKCFKMEYRQCALRHVRQDAKVLVNFERKFLSEMLLTELKPPGKKIGQEVITKCFVSCGISSREIARQLDLFD
ncbi:hypothetical protein AVEN_88526-1 [Araneus ventricosus]|uniref:Uncharacterized protein n=1 Tax=Araneus ventricosus TaxID=182803 RepID=A0A4Y2E5J2_ARAVE|nr:hypothetical protein AVEN_88526-1 [Araneus ventricosus]